MGGKAVGFLEISVQSHVEKFLLSRKTRLESKLLLLLAVFAFLVRIWGISKTHFWDEMVYLQNAEVICCGKSNYSELDFRAPLISLIYAGVLRLWHHVYAACIVTALLNALGPVFLYLAGRRSVGRLPAAIAASLLAFSPFFVGVIPAGLASDDTGNSLLTDSPALTLLIVAFWLLLRALDGQSALLFGCAGLTLALSILMRFGTLPIAGILLFVTVLSKRPSKSVVWCSVGLLLGLLPYLIWSRLSFGSLFFTLDAGWTHAEESTESSLFYLRNLVAIMTPVALLGTSIAAASWLRHCFFPVSPQPRLPASLPSSNLSAGALQGFLWIWLLMGFVFFSVVPHKEPRYILPIAPPFLLLAGFGLAVCCTYLSKKFEYLGEFTLAALLLFTFLPLRERLSCPFIDSRDPVEMVGSRFLQTNLPRETTLYMSFNYPAFAFYTNFRIHELSGVGPVLYQEIEHIPRGGVLIVYRNTDEAREPKFGWVDANPTFKRLRDFGAFVIYRRL